MRHTPIWNPVKENKSSNFEISNYWWMRPMIPMCAQVMLCRRVRSKPSGYTLGYSTGRVELGFASLPVFCSFRRFLILGNFIFYGRTDVIHNKILHNKPFTLHLVWMSSQDSAFGFTGWGPPCMATGRGITV
jgi:hypothetical protein